jgi:hypothetical protein
MVEPWNNGIEELEVQVQREKMSNAKAQMPNQIQNPNAKTVRRQYLWGPAAILQNIAKATELVYRCSMHRRSPSLFLALRHLAFF